MEIKNPTWDECVGSPESAIGKYSKGESKIVDKKVKIGSQVFGRYGGDTVAMDIIEVKPNHCFIAKVQYVNSSINISSPGDMAEGDLVSIDWKHICWITNK
jgi:hypothetical protein